MGIFTLQLILMSMTEVAKNCKRDLCNLIWMRAKIRRGRNVKQEESWSLKRMQNIFTNEELEYFIKISDKKLSYGKEETNH